MSSDESPGELKQRMMTAAQELSRKVGVRAACEALEVSPATFYRRRQSSSASKPSSGRASSPRALAPKERQTVHDTLNSERFVDQAPTEVYATLLDAGKYLCSVRTMYRILEEHAELRERRDQLRHPNYEKPVLLATGPNQVWSWDITKLLGPMKWVYFHLYVILDIFSRYVVGWMLAERESAELAKRLIKETCSKQGIVAEQLTLHADRGTSMKSKPLAMLLSDLGVTKTHSRPQVSNDNPYSESQFKTLKYRPEFPKRFGSIQHARDVCRDLFGWYNTEHYHSGIGLLTPESVHYGRAAMIVEGRRQVLLDFFGAHPERFVNGAPKPPEIPSAAWINPPTTKTTHQIGAQAVSEASDDLQVPLICNIYGEPVVSNSAASVTRTATQPRANSGKPGVTVRPPSAAHGSLHGRRHISGCSLNTRSRCLKIIDNYRREQRPYELQDLEGNSITKPEARALAEQWKVTEEVRKRLRNKKTLAQERWEAPPSVTSEPKAPRNGRPSQPADPNPERLSVTTDQLKMLVFKSLEQMLNSGGNVEEIRLQLKEEAANFFQERA